MEDLKKAILEREVKPEHVKKEIARRVEAKIKKEELFLKNYDEVLNKHILNVFRKTVEEFDRNHDHRALKIINGEVVRLRLDSLQGQAEGIKIFFDQEQLPMYIWFSPDIVLEKIVFKMVYGNEEKTEFYNLEEISKEFLIDLIAKKFMTIKSYL